jgi:hypothetical protein
MLTDDLSAHSFCLLCGERRSQTSGDDINEDLHNKCQNISFFRMRARSECTNGFRSKCGDSGTEELFRLDAFNEAHISTRVRGQFETEDGFLHSENLG